MSYTGLSKSQIVRFTSDINLFIDYAIENSDTEATICDSNKHLKSIALQFVEDYGKKVSKKSKTGNKLSDEEIEERDELKAQKSTKEKLLNISV